jgi:hypothetical protein
LFYINKEGIVKESRDNNSIYITSKYKKKYKWDIYMAYYHVSIFCTYVVCKLSMIGPLIDEE